MDKIFIPRADRYAYSLPIGFNSQDGLVNGRSINVSESGMLAVFDKPVDVWLVGELSMHVRERPIRIKARVARVQGRDAGLSFRIATDAERHELLLLLATAKEEGELLEFGDSGKRE